MWAKLMTRLGVLPVLSFLWLQLWPSTGHFGVGVGADAFVIPNSAFREMRAGRGGVRPPHSVFSTNSDQSEGNGNVSGSDSGSENDSEDNWTEGGRVAVEVRKKISFPPGSFRGGSEANNPLGAASERVRDAWMEYHWKKGGGLPIVILEKQEMDDESNVGGSHNSAHGQKRVIAPVMMEETISSFPLQAELLDGSGSGCDASLELEYKVTSPGPFFGPDLVQGSHTGRVTFESSYAPVSDDDSNDDDTAKAITTTLVWKVEFDAIRLVALYQKVTEFTIGTAATTVQEAVATPRLLTLQARLRLPSGGGDDPAHTARKEWLEFLFSTQGGGMPLPPPLPFGEVLAEGGGMARKKLFRFPGIFETAMVKGPTAAGSGETIDEGHGESVIENGTATVYYRLENPGWWTSPFLYHTHLGRARFRPGASTPAEEATESHHPIPIDMIWEVEIRPYPFAAPLVEKLTEMTISTIARNLQVKMEAPGAVVPLWGGSGQPLGSVPRATWVGRVLEARSSDTRSALEQSVSLLAPWTWADSGTGRLVEDGVDFEWSDGGME